MQEELAYPMALKVVVSGGPCAGKTSLVNFLRAKGFSTTPETARQLIADQQKTPDPIIPWKKPQEFQDLLWKTNVEKEKNLPEDNILIMDRCAVDIIGFCDFLKTKKPENWQEFFDKQRYDLIIIPEMLHNYKEDPQRAYKEQESYDIHQAIKDLYTELGYAFLELPIAPIEKRAELVLEAIKKLPQTL